MMKIIIAGATGFIGRQLVKKLLLTDNQLIIVGRSIVKIKQLFGESVQAVAWDGLTVDILSNVKAIINLAGAGIGDQRWTAKRRQTILLSRTQTTYTLAQLCVQAGAQAPILFNASAIGVYGLQPSLCDQLPVPYNENSVINFQQTPDFLAKIARAWEMAAKPAELAGVRVVYLRFGVVLAKQGGALPRIALPFKWGLGGTLGAGRQPFSWIALKDLLSAIEFLLNKDAINGPVNLVAPQCVTQKQLASALASVLHRPAFMHTPAWLLKILLGEMAEELLLQGQHVVPEKLLTAGFRFQYPTIEAALKEIYQ